MAFSERNFGLDFCRSLAILSVVLGYMLQYSSPNQHLADLGFLAIFGVDLFFCLSGFLIGRILLYEADAWPYEKDFGLTRFWYRRWMSTLPLYFFFFGIELFVYQAGNSSLLKQLPYSIFAQNLAWPMPDFYRLTWSLAIEEWFYFLFPLILLFLIGLGKNPRTATAVTFVIFIVLPPILRIIFFQSDGKFNTLDPHIRHVVVFRLDAIGFGVLVAFLNRWHETAFEKISRYWWIFFCLSVLCIAFIKISHFGLTLNKFYVAAYFSLSAIAFAGLLPRISKILPTSNIYLNKFIQYTSLVSYSLYLGHVIALISVIALLKRLGFYGQIYSNAWITYFLFLFAVYALASSTYFIIEKPFLKFRDRNSRINLPQPLPVIAARH